MSEYHKIDSMFKRDGKRLMIDELEWARPEFGELAGNEWLFTEKVDGTNIRLYFDGSGSGAFEGNEHAFIMGRTDNASIPPKLLNRLVELQKTMPLDKVFGEAKDVVLYGEGYGAGIQKGGGNYAASPDFVLFDVTVAGWTLTRDSVEDVADKLGIEVVPVVDRGTLYDALDLARDGYDSKWPGVQVPEGLVCRPSVDLWNRKGERVITKIKHRDFR